ncbi:MAG: hypothetical protein OXC07_08970, partial [Kistimonas sp.]|nr:hypothetical protein [Kistimonas sp.]
MFPQSLKRLGGLVVMVVSLSAGQPVYAGEGGVAKVRAPVCVRGDCRPAPGAQMQSLILQTAALSVARGSGSAQAVKQKLRNFPQSRRARLPSWYKRAQAAEVRGQSSSVPQLRAGSVQPSARTRVRESVKPAVSEQSQGRDQVRQGRAAVAVTTTSEASRVRSAAGSRPATRGMRHRRLVQESLDAMDGEMGWDTGGRGPRSASAQGPYDPTATPLGSANFISGIKANLSGNYRLAGAVALNSTEGLPLGNDSHPFRGKLTGTSENSLQLNLAKDGGGDLSLFGGLEDAHINMTVRDSELRTSNGSVSLFGGRTENSTLDLKVRDSVLEARGGNASLVEKIEDGSTFLLSMDGTRLDAEMNGTDKGSGLLVAGPVAHTDGSETFMRLYDSSDNIVQAKARPGAVTNGSSPLVEASLGWGYVDIQGRENDLCQNNVSNNSVRAVLDGASSQLGGSQEGRAYASLAGSYEPGFGHHYDQGGDDPLHRLEQWGVRDNRIEAEVQNKTEGVAVASLGLVYEAHKRGNFSLTRTGGFNTRQQECRNNTVKAGVLPPSNSSMAVASVALAVDDSSCGYRCDKRCSGGECSCETMVGPTVKTACPLANPSFMQRDVGDNQLAVVGGNPAINSRTVVGSVGRGESGDNGEDGEYDNCPAFTSLFLAGHHVQLFSGG